MTISPPDLSDAPVSGHHHDGRHVVLQGAVQEGETLDVQHVDLREDSVRNTRTFSTTDLVDEENPGGDLRLALLPPLGHLRVDLVPDLSNESLSGN